MLSRKISAFLAMGLAAGFIGCASTPSVVQVLPPDSNPNTEIEKTQSMIQEASNRQIDVLSPSNFNKAEDSLQKAMKYRQKGKSSSEVLEQVSLARGWLKDALDKSKLTVSQMPEIQDARRGAMNARANELFPKEWNSTGKKLESITKDIEKGNLKPVDKKGDDIVAAYRKLERDSVVKMALGKADENIRMAEKEKAEKIAPKTYSSATMSYDTAAKAITANPRNPAAYSRAVDQANRESMRLVDVTNQVKAGNSEDLVLQSERQQRAISSLRKENMQSEKEMTAMERQQAELQRSQALINQAASIRSQFKPNEAEVYTENGRVMVRLKGLQFAPNQANLDKRDKALLSKMDEALAGMGPSKVIVEGHTDNTGKASRNMTLSEQRAKSVQDYLVSKGTVTLDNVESVGMGSEKPIGNNGTAAGRAQNRRIDLIVEPISR